MGGGDGENGKMKRRAKSANGVERRDGKAVGQVITMKFTVITPVAYFLAFI